MCCTVWSIPSTTRTARSPDVTARRRRSAHRAASFAVARCIAGAATLAALLATAGAAQADPAAIVVLRALDKITARVSIIEVPVGESVAFGSLEITARYCDKRPPTETPESAAFLEVVELEPGEPAALRFSGWMFASSPALSAMDHPVYDLWVIDCTNESSTESGSSQ